MKIDEFKIPCVTYLTKKTYGSLSVTVWPNPSDGQPKICVQGKMYLAFISFVLPLVLKDMKTSKAITDASDNNENSDILSNEETGESTDLGRLNGTLKRLEIEVLNISNIVVDKVDLALSNVAPEATTASLLDRVEKLEITLKANQEQFTNLASL